MTAYANKNVLITGAASGLGRLMAFRIAAEGGSLILWDVDRQGLVTTESELAGQGAKVRSYACDLTDRRAIAASAARTIADCGPVDILINNAGIVSGKTLLAASDQDIQRTFDVNSLALFWTTRAFLPAMLERNSGHVVTIASAAGIVGTSKLVDYCASKHAAVGFDEALRLELRRQKSKVRTTVVCPFYISTGMFEGVKSRFAFLLPIMKPEYVVDRIIKGIRANRRRVVLPRFVYATYLARLLPGPIFDAVMGILGINKTMDAFVGRAGHQEPPARVSGAS